MRISDWSSDVCSSDLSVVGHRARADRKGLAGAVRPHLRPRPETTGRAPRARARERDQSARSEEHTSELQSLMRISYAVFCLKKKNKADRHIHSIQNTSTQPLNRNKREEIDRRTETNRQN